MPPLANFQSFAQKCCPSIVKGFVYLWHPDALDTFDDYFGATSRFQERRETVWTTTITISHWCVGSNSDKDPAQFQETRKNGDFPPAGIAALGGDTYSSRTTTGEAATYIMEERSSSLVITGDPSGYFWICSIWSSLTEHESVSVLIQSLPQVLQSFINQQVSGRCLVFLILLGHFSEKLAEEYESILKRLDTIVELGDRVLLQGLEWGTTKAVDKLKKMLWGLEALRVFDDRLSASLSQIQKAREAMERTIKQLHVDLLQEYLNVLEEFEKRYGMLSDVQIRTQLKIRQVTGLRDGISAVTNVLDNRTTIKQGNNIRILTYITIAYLPLGFVSGLFSINHASFMDNASNALYAVLTVVFVVGTYGLALSLETIIEQWVNFRDGEWRPKRMRGRKEVVELPS
ncbi:hypothetical protein N431DRAFT_345331 [Stipitochalara longipes BDJ]|nr:hypothetical protein N431DRAFT_345331 [Stipitochalara longipes BDJ]